MVLVKRNSKEFKEVKGIIEDYSEKPTRKRLIRIYALKPGEKKEKAVLLNKLKKDEAVLYDMSFEAIMEMFWDKGEKLYREEKKPFYFFKSSANSNWLKNPFELTGKLKKQVFPLSVVK